jgi:hypothetical protein
MRTISGINGSHGKLDGQPALGREGDYVENFPYTQALGNCPEELEPDEGPQVDEQRHIR